MLPGAGSIAINMGNPSDITDAQNSTISGGRRDVGAAEVINTVGIVVKTGNINLSIYPNPVKSKLTIENKEININTISILNITGGIVKTTKENTNVIDVSNLTKGIYFLQIHTDNGLVSKKFVKE
ncbi:MAG: hypothetical protein ACJAUR_002064 [Ulvibacter sp.]|jgi:hypothetical protein